MFLPGIKLKTSKSDYFPIQQLKLGRFDGERWSLFGDVYLDEDRGCIERGLTLRWFAVDEMECRASSSADIADLHVPLAGSQPSIARSDHRNASCCLDFIYENAVESTTAWRNRSQIETGEVVCGLRNHNWEQRTEAFLVWWPTGYDMKTS